MKTKKVLIEFTEEELELIKFGLEDLYESWELLDDEERIKKLLKKVKKLKRGDWESMNNLLKKLDQKRFEKIVRICKEQFKEVLEKLEWPKKNFGYMETQNVYVDIDLMFMNIMKIDAVIVIVRNLD